MNDAHEEQITYVTGTIYNKETGKPIILRTRLNDLLQAPPDGEPSETIFDELGRPQRLVWHHENFPHRDGAPAWITLNPENGIHISEYYFSFGWHREKTAGPYRIQRDSETGEIVREVFEGDPDFIETISDPHLEP